MATTNYGWNLPSVGGDQDTWGDELNAAIGEIDAQMATNQAAPGRLLSAGVSSVAAVTIALSADQEIYRLDLVNTDPAIDAQKLGLQFSVDGGITYLSGSSDYSYAGSVITAAAAETAFGDDANDRIVLTPNNMTNSSGFCQRFTVNIFAISGQNTVIDWRGWVIQASSLANQLIHGAGRMASAAKPTHVRVLFPSGNVARCTYNVAARG